MSLGQDAVDFAAEAGLFLDPWQQRVLLGAMGVGPGGKWAARQVGLLVPRQNGKGSVLEARELYAMFVGDERLIIHSAHRYDTSQDHFRRVMELIEGNPDLDRHVKNVSKVIGKESITLKSRCQLKFKARTLSGSGRGFSCDLLVLDESFLLPEQAVSAMLPTLAARPNPQTWFTSSSGFPESRVLWRVVERGRARSERLAYFEWGCETGVDVQDRANWAVANPGMLFGRPSLESFEDDLGTLLPEDFARERLGVWEAMAASNVIPLDAWAACQRPASQIDGTPVFSIDVAPLRDWVSIGVAGKTATGDIQVEVVDRRRGTDWAVARAVEVCGTWSQTRIFLAAGQAADSLRPDLEAAGLNVVTVSGAELGQACGAFHDAVTAGQLVHLGDKELYAAVAGAVRLDRDGAFTWARRKSTTDITALYAVTLAAWAAKTGVPIDVSASVW